MNYLDKLIRKDQIMQDSMKPGYVYKLTSGIFGIVVYRAPGSNKTELLCRVIDTDSVLEACEILRSQFAGAFTPANADQAQWGNAVWSVDSSVKVLTNI